jgi:hypothetical protein
MPMRLTRPSVIAMTIAALSAAAVPADGIAQTPKTVPSCVFSPGASAGPAFCIRAENFNHDICSAIEFFAASNGMPPDYFARLIWRESRFRPDAVSPKGARGIAQFMPATAALRGLKDSTDALQSLRASARYLDELRTRFGNLGLAAAAYNAGEQRLSDFLTSGSLPFETRAYVFGVTGHSVEEWKATPKALALPVLDDQRSFMDACIALAETRRLVDPAVQSEGVWAPWGAQLAAAPTSATARLLFSAAIARLPAPLASEEPLIIRKRNRNFGFRPRYSARIGRAERAEAEQTCVAVRRAGLPCLVFKNF